MAYKDGVYDITEFLKAHPGGSDKLMLAAGGYIEPFWKMYKFHEADKIYALLDKYKIGELHPDDVLKPDQISDFSAMKDYIVRSNNLIILSDQPFNAQTVPKLLGSSPLTP